MPALERALRTGEDLVRGHAAWALGRLPGEEASRALQEAKRGETEPWVREEIDAALRNVSTANAKAGGG